jgi:transaldolase
LVAEGHSTQAIYEALVIEDIRRAADLLRPLYDETNGADGFVSLEVSPDLAHDTQATVDEARRLFARLQRPNAMIKVPATSAGIPAIRTLIAEGININVTLIFSLAHYTAVAEAYIAGLQDLCDRDGDPGRVASVASFFVSRIDSAVDKLLAKIDNRALQGKIAVANAKAARMHYRDLYASAKWQPLAQKGARPQRLLWASTGTKNPDYADTLYVDTLIGSHTVNTVPPDTLNAFMAHGTVAPTLDAGMDDARLQLEQLSAAGIDLVQVAESLQTEGVAAFAASFHALINGVREKRAQYQS